MSLIIRPDEKDSSKLAILIDGKFDFNIRKPFRDAYSSADPKIKHFILDMLKATYIDSSGLGMLLILKEHADQIGGSVTVINANPAVKELLELSNFGQLFDIK